MPFSTLDYERADLRARLAALTLEVKLLRWAHALRRVAGGWSRKDKDGDVEGPEDTDDGPARVWGSVQYAQAGDFPRDHNGPPSGPLPAEILPVDKPVGAGKVAPALRDAAKLSIDVGISAVILAAPWTAAFAPTILSYNDPARSLSELQTDIGKSEAGYDDHHIVEQSPARQDGFSEQQINGRDNLVKIPRMKHWDINKFYSTPNSDLDGLSPRQFLQGQSWETRYEYGLQTLRNFKVLAP